MRWLQAVIDWLFSRSVLVQLSLEAPITDRRRGPDPPKRPYDPDSWVTAPKRHGPTGRSASVAVVEPVLDENVVAVGGVNDSVRFIRHRSGDALRR